MAWSCRRRVLAPKRFNFERRDNYPGTGGMLDVWQGNKSLELAEVDVIDVKPRDEIEASWEEFFYSHHYMVTDRVTNSYLFQHPRRSCDAFASATLMCDPWHDNPFPGFEKLEELQACV